MKGVELLSSKLHDVSLFPRTLKVEAEHVEYSQGGLHHLHSSWSPDAAHQPLHDLEEARAVTCGGKGLSQSYQGSNSGNTFGPVHLIYSQHSLIIFSNTKQWAEDKEMNEWLT